jgi:membrane protein DedA with SNARE-associated domain
MPGLVMLAVLGALLADAAPQKSDSTSWGYIVLVVVAVVVVAAAVVVLLRRRRR